MLCKSGSTKGKQMQQCLSEICVQALVHLGSTVKVKEKELYMAVTSSKQA
jgi:hypothetical protein